MPYCLVWFDLLSVDEEWRVGGEPEGTFCRWCWGVGVGMWQRVYFEGRVKGSPVKLN